MRQTNPHDNQAPDAFRIREYRPGDLGYMDYMHCRLYAEEYGFDGLEFEPYVLPAMGRLLEAEDRSGSMVWVAEDGDAIIGSIAIVKAGEGEAQLRWFLIDPSARSQGLGNAFMEKALDFCRKENYVRVHLWTIQRLEAARHLYEKFGFQVTETVSHFLWGIDLTEERWDLVLRP